MPYYVGYSALYASLKVDVEVVEALFGHEHQLILQFVVDHDFVRFVDLGIYSKNRLIYNHINSKDHKNDLFLVLHFQQQSSSPIFEVIKDFSLDLLKVRVVIQVQIFDFLKNISVEQLLVVLVVDFSLKIDQKEPIQHVQNISHFSDHLIIRYILQVNLLIITFDSSEYLNGYHFSGIFVNQLQHSMSLLEPHICPFDIINNMQSDGFHCVACLLIFVEYSCYYWESLVVQRVHVFSLSVHVPKNVKFLQQVQDNVRYLAFVVFEVRRRICHGFEGLFDHSLEIPFIRNLHLWVDHLLIFRQVHELVHNIRESELIVHLIPEWVVEVDSHPVRQHSGRIIDFVQVIENKVLYFSSAVNRCFHF